MAFVNRLRKTKKLWESFLAEALAQEELPEWVDSFLQREVLPELIPRWPGIQTIEDWLQSQEISTDRFSKKVIKTEIPLWCYSEDWTLDNEKVEEELLPKLRK